MHKFFALILGLSFTTVVFCKDESEKLVIISPHRKSVQEEIVPKFKEYYKEKFKKDIIVEWLDQGGATNDLRYILTRFSKLKNTSDLDLLWGGGEHPHFELDGKGLLQPYKISDELKAQIPEQVSGVYQYNKAETWHASAVSSFGIFYNKALLKRLKIPEPKNWQDLASEKFYDHLSNADPRQSSSNVTMNFVILQAFGWEKGWENLSKISANTKVFRHSSADPIKDVVSGDALASTAIGYFANAKIGDLGETNLGFNLPEGTTIINPDPISILKGAPNVLQAQRFIDYVLSVEAQKLLLLPKGKKSGPKHHSLARMSVNKKAYEETEKIRISTISNPFSFTVPPMSLDAKKVTDLQFILVDLIGAMLIDHHKELKEAWAVIIKSGLKKEDINYFSKLPVTEIELIDLAKKWNNQLFRNKTINKWSVFAKEKYAKIIKKEKY